METLDERLKELVMEIDATRELYETLPPIDINDENYEEIQEDYDESYNMIQENIDEANKILKTIGKTLIPNLIKRI